MSLALQGERGIVIPADNFPFKASSPELDPQGISYEIMRWPDYTEMTDILGNKVQQSGKQFDAVVSLLRGGSFPGELLAQRLFIPHDTLGVKLYKGIQAKGEAASEKLVIYKDLNHPDRISGTNLLLVDDVNDTSSTLRGVLEFLKNNIGIASVEIAVLHEKPSHRQMEADYVARQTDSWIVYPWEHDGGPLHDRWEFFRERLPGWMITDEDEMMNWDQVLERCLDIGFHLDELPSLDNQNFMGWLSTNINDRYQKVFGRSISGSNGWHILFPQRDMPGPSLVESQISAT